MGAQQLSGGEGGARGFPATLQDCRVVRHRRKGRGDPASQRRGRERS